MLWPLALLLVALIALEVTRAEDPGTAALVVLTACAAAFSFARFVIGEIAGARRVRTVPLWTAVVILSVFAVAGVYLWRGDLQPPSPLGTGMSLGFLLEVLAPDRAAKRD